MSNRSASRRLHAPARPCKTPCAVAALQAEAGRGSGHGETRPPVLWGKRKRTESAGSAQATMAAAPAAAAVAALDPSVTSQGRLRRDRSDTDGALVPAETPASISDKSCRGAGLT
eukprot:CAMPEP_0197922250 /NCGR_PEP_ID=MMETSP1439-20131203/92032_1 /TAXON_ID=66791 /ORGANISM="Gonyaulax spinifera, Strain CCMP409" /LENGTH=114 /DNA_ID=CAMNT_0043544545 /DNA_START=29 /DNA_END=370 /DNA_ORIENTATION=-